MRYFPINLDVRDRSVLVVGGGTVALRKVQALANCGARIAVVSPEFCPELAALDGISRIERHYRAGDIAGACLVISATDSEQVNRQVYQEATAVGILCNVVDQPDLCSFTIPAVLARGDLTIAISTGGASPALAGRLRRQLEKHLSPALATHVRLLAKMRPQVKDSSLSLRDRSRLLRAMACEAIGRMIEQHGEERTRHHLRQMLVRALAKTPPEDGNR